MTDTPPLTLTIPSDQKMLSVARAFVEAACQIAGLEKTCTYAVVLSTGEAFTNIIRHAHRNKSQANVQIQCWINSEGIELRFNDEGEPFDFDSVPELNPAELRIGGRGVYMMRRLMDEITCTPRPQGGNSLRMVKFSQTLAARECG